MNYRYINILHVSYQIINMKIKGMQNMDCIKKRGYKERHMQINMKNLLHLPYNSLLQKSALSHGYHL